MKLYLYTLGGPKLRVDSDLPVGVELMEWIIASETPISDTPTSDGWKRISGTWNLSLFIRII
jgi:hypothetical protein